VHNTKQRAEQAASLIRLHPSRRRAKSKRSMHAESFGMPTNHLSSSPCPALVIMAYQERPPALFPLCSGSPALFLRRRCSPGRAPVQATTPLSPRPPSHM
jgi:hypothetical protein